VAVLDEIAVEVGVSRRTVAAVLGGSYEPRYAAARRRAVLIRQAADRMGYRPNAAAKAVSTGRFRNVGLLMGTHYERSNFTRELIRGIHDGLVSQSMQLTISFLDDEVLESQDKLPAILREQMVDGLLINYTHAIPPHMQEAIERARLPVVWVNVKREGHACVYPDDLHAGYQATGHLWALGHRRIVFADFVHGPNCGFEPHYSVMDRRAGYEQAIRHVGGEPSFVTFARRLDGAAAVQLAAAMLDTPQRPTAVIGQAPRDAAIWHGAALAKGLRVPEDLSLITFGQERLGDNILDFTRLIEPGEEMGRLAAENLLKQIDHLDPAASSCRVHYSTHRGQTVAESHSFTSLSGGTV
jgi:LacI family transcriptional regulator